MASMFFGQYLLAKGIIRRDALLDALRRQRAANLSLPELGLREGMLDERQAATIMLAFRTSDLSIEKIALSTGYLDQSQIDALLDVQRDEHLRIGDALVAGGHISRDVVLEHLAEFTREERLEQQRLEANFDEFAEKDVVVTCLNLTAFHFGRISGRAVKLRGLERAAGELAGGSVRYAQDVVGDKRFCIAVDLPQVLMREIAAGLLHLSTEISDEAARDAACEFVNLIAGNACTHLETAGYRLRPEPPFIVGGDETLPPQGPSVRASFISEDADFEVHLILGGSTRS